MIKRVAGSLVVALIGVLSASALAADLPEVREKGVLRHLGIPYANFVTGGGDGMDVELIRNFARYLGVRYKYVKSDWDTVTEDLTGAKIVVTGGEPEIIGEGKAKGDLVANGFTLLPWRQKVMAFSDPTFMSQIWLMARADSVIKPIKGSGNVDTDIAAVKALLKGRKVLALKNTCLDPDLYDLASTGADISCFRGKLNELAPAVINGEAETTILDAPDALVALQKWPGKLKVIGPVSRKQEMGVAFAKTSPKLLAAFNAFLRESRRNGSYDRLVKKYYPTAAATFPEFFTIR